MLPSGSLEILIRMFGRDLKQKSSGVVGREWNSHSQSVRGVYDDVEELDYQSE